MPLAEKVSVLVTSSYIPTHPDTGIVEATLESLSLLGVDSGVKVVLSQDGLPVTQSDPHARSAYRDYLQRIQNRPLSIQRPEIIVRENWGHLNGTIETGLKAVSTEFVVVVQHDMRFVRSVDLQSLIEVMEKNPEIKHVRFNVNPITEMNWDAEFSHRGTLYDRRDFLREERFEAPGGSLPLVRTLAWSDNNYLCRVGYLTDRVLPLLRGLRGFPEDAVNPLNTRDHHEVWGTYIWGAWDDPPVIEHLDGRNFGTDTDYDSPPQRTMVRQLKKHVKHATIRLSARVRFFLLKRGLLRHHRAGQASRGLPAR